MNKYLFIALSILFMVVISPACSRAYIIDAPAETPGYQLFKGDSDFPVQFEYPESWRRTPVQQHEDARWVDLENGSVAINVACDKPLSTTYSTAEGMIAHLLERAAPKPELTLIAQNFRPLGGFEGSEVVVSYHLVFRDAPGNTSAVVDKMVAEQEVAVDYGGRIFSVFFLVDLEQLADVQMVYDHLVDTFRFIED